MCSDWAETGHGPGLGFQTRSGRLVIPCFETKPVGGKWGTSWSFIIYSDDHGKTWQMSDNEVGPSVNESQVVELTDGSLFLKALPGNLWVHSGASRILLAS